MNCQEEAYKLFDEQSINWSLLKTNIQGLKSARLKTFEFDGYTINIQYNPKRIISSSAKVDKKSIQNRKCFLCSENRPDDQNEIKLKEDYILLCNPFPIFNKHYTITKTKHIAQSLEIEFANFLNISRSLPDFVTFYNAPKCGASAPDHLHFQAGNKGFMPIEKELDLILSKYGETISEQSTTKISAVDDGLRRFIVLESDEATEIIKQFQLIFNYTKKLENNEEPMLNILSYFDEKWRVLIFLRAIHRPWQYFEKGDKNILFSPASVDLGGTMITPLEKDFDKITKNDITDMMQQITMSANEFEKLKKEIINAQ